MPKQSAVDRAALAAAAFGGAADAVDEAAAAHLGINRTDLRLLGIVQLEGPRSAGQLSIAAGLSPAATTEAVQRLVGRGYLAREVDPGDRRRALITMGPDVTGVLEQIYGPVAQEGAKMLREYTDEELALITAFLERGRTFQEEQAARIRRQIAESAAPS